MQTLTLIEKTRSLTRKIRNEYQENPTEEMRESIQEEIDDISKNIRNPTLGCLKDLYKIGKRNSFSVSSIKDQLISY